MNFLRPVQAGLVLALMGLRATVAQAHADTLQLAIFPPSNGLVAMSWPSGPAIRLQQASDVAAPSWGDVANTLGQSSAKVPITQSPALFRLSTVGSPVDNSTNLVRNSGFEADGAPVQTPYRWTTSGNASAASVVAGGYAGSYSLQHSNSAAYQVETSQLVTNLANGFYSLSAYCKCSGGQKACYIAGNDRPDQPAASVCRLDTADRTGHCRHERPMPGARLFRRLGQQLVPRGRDQSAQG